MTLLDIAHISTATATVIAAVALLLNWCAFRANAKAIESNAKALERNAKTTDTASYTTLADRIDEAYDGFRRAHRQHEAGVGIGAAEHRHAAERFLAVITDSCHLYLSDLFLPATREMVGVYLDTVLPLDYEYLREIARDPGEEDPYRYIREFGEHRKNQEIVGQFPPARVPKALPQGQT